MLLIDWIAIYPGLAKDNDAAIALLPRGSGFDASPTIVSVSCHKIVLDVPWHRMDEHGYYDGWVTFRVTALPCFGGGFDVQVRGGRKVGDAGVREYVGDVYHEALSTALTTALQGALREGSASAAMRALYA